ncbi:MAG TPA: PTS glucose transporter subunit IIA [Pseudonocardia sp.]|uniref:PTS sugar transporter subunit IIA n=1 Tax=Pseudonocardia sp. TaxID=60912 RepID=UPI002EDACBCE
MTLPAEQHTRPSALPVGAPLAGTLTALTEVPDPVFAGQLVGAGVAIEPPAEPGPVQVVAPIDGTLAKLHPHAFILVAAGGTGVLVHLGIDTVTLEGDGFTLHVAEGERVSAGAPIVSFDPAQVRARGLSAICPIVVLDSAPDSVPAPASGARVQPGDLLFRWPDGHPG